jgi:DNA sulfur modification protein DndB
MATFVPAMRAKMGDLEYFVSAVTLGEAARMIDYVEEIDDWTSETPSQLKLQRKLNIQRVEREMVPYLTTSKHRFYSSLTVEIRPAPFGENEGTIAFERLQSFPGGIEFGTLTLDGTESLYALDGQHRLKSIERAIRHKPELARDHISLILVPFRDITRSQTLFSDLNRYAKPPSKSLSLLFSHDDPIARVAKTLADQVPLLRNRTNMETTSLSSNSRYFITLSTLHEMTKAFLGDRPLADGESESSAVADQSEIWGELTKAFVEWGMVAAGEEHPAYLRQQFLHMHGVAHQGIGRAVARARAQLGPGWREAVATLGRLDWRLTNLEWHGVALHGGRVHNTDTSVRMLSELLQVKLGLRAPRARTPVSAAVQQ